MKLFYPEKNRHSMTGLKIMRNQTREKMKLKIGVMGSASGKLSKAHKKIAYELQC